MRLARIQPDRNSAIREYLLPQTFDRPAMSDLQQLIEDLSSSEVARQRDAATAMMSTGGAETAAVELVHAVGSDDPELVEAANAVLEGIETITTEQAALLAGLLSEKATPEKSGASLYWAATLLGRIGSEAAPFVESMVAALTWCQDLPALQRIVWAIGKVGPAAKNAVSALQPLTASDDPRLARLATRTIEEISA